MFSNNGIIKFIWLLRSDIYPCEYMEKREKFNETSSPEKDDFYSDLNMESITEADYNHPKRISQPTNIGPKDVPRTSLSSVLRMPLKILFDHPGDVRIWGPGDISKKCPRDVLVWRPLEDVFKIHFRGPSKDVLGTLLSFLFNVSKFHFTSL